jgi:hypothetical protein
MFKSRKTKALPIPKQHVTTETKVCVFEKLPLARIIEFRRAADSFLSAFIATFQSPKF